MNSNVFEQMEERSEVIFTSKQLVFLAFSIVVLVLISFIIGFSMGKKSERKRAKLGINRSSDLLARLDKLEKEAKNFKAKRALTALRKREINTEEKDVNNQVKVLTPRVSLKKSRKSASKKYSLALAKIKRNGFGKKHKIVKRRTWKRRRTVAKRRVRRNWKKRRNFVKNVVSKKQHRFAKRSAKKSRNFRRRRKVYAFKKSSHKRYGTASLR